MNINKILEEAPAQISKLAQSAEDSRFIWKCAEIQKEQLEAKKHLLYKAEKDGLTAPDLKAKVVDDEAVYQKRMECLTLESAYKKRLIEMESWINAFTSARKKASLQIEELKSLNNTIIQTTKTGGRV